MSRYYRKLQEEARSKTEWETEICKNEGVSEQKIRDLYESENQILCNEWTETRRSVFLDPVLNILDENRRANAELFERAFYSGKGQQAHVDQATGTPQDTNAETIMKLLNNPEAVALMKQLIAAVESQKD